ncbi:MAG: ice-binding family protein [Fimbriimonadaceae bacterium]
MKKTKQGTLLFLPILTSLVLAGCGGGSGGNPSQGPARVELGTAGDFTIFANTGIDNATPSAAITGDIGVGPGVTSTAITGFSLSLAPGAPSSTSAQVSGQVYAFDYADPTPAYVTTASADMGAAYTDAAGRTLPDFLNLNGGLIGGLTLAPGLYKWGTDVTIAFGTNLTISGGANDVWIFQIDGNLTTAAATNIILAGGAKAKNVFWQVAGTSVTMGANSSFKGIVLAQNAINLGNQASVNGRLFAQTAANLDQNSVTRP